MTLNLFQTITQTFNRVNGYTYARLGQGPDKVLIDVRYDKNAQAALGEHYPVSVRVVRPNRQILLSCQNTMENQQPVMILSAEVSDRTYGKCRQTCATNGTLTATGDERALENCMSDPVMSDYISFVSDQDRRTNKPVRSVWHLDRDMKCSR